MLCKIADLLVEIPEAGGIAPRLMEYLTESDREPDITISADAYDYSLYSNCLEDIAAYMESGHIFYVDLLRFNGLMLHSSAVEYEGKAYLFSGPSGMGKSTHTRLWQKIFGASAKVFNDDKPALRRLDDGWFAYGTPWCGKDDININLKVPLSGICFLKRAETNSIRRLSDIEAVAAVISQTVRRFATKTGLDKMTAAVERLVREIPIYELKCRPDEESVLLSYETMKNGV